ncbi:MAG: tRNA (N6-isopentenyl adenosine(37)-C2)-methylthiotransferase MiaB [Paracoccus sp.]|uniref:tRNA (N6-isopentenyl adenosine(37)-C2)-methylthiotransferase MiaB n=1 Tax=Paracoccus sp. TaxID=267 RepID=UPI000C5082C0|nr:tRNA (N6-isopentenyl adenosine(37)-C2)-methylthiotransferase MiaB [Paracoccus sp. (in: a-proteobacteria)]MBA49105.1 tRNA (N6-isopentenyl adenosine(37)-C2)-methylthiotransferase MiaB [Paracoccus sp. (in: a-proteobacteria)]
MSDKASTAPVKKLFIKTYGCQMNVYDSQRMAEAMGAEGYVLTEDQADADMVLLNPCHIREKAAEKLYSDLGRLKPLKAEKPDLTIGVAGCVAQAEGEEIVRRMPLVDLVVGPQTYHRLPAMVRGQAPRILTDFPAEDKFDHLPAPRATRRAPAAFLTVQEGCDKFCAFCVVPYTRGAEVSRPADRILREARDLVARGVREITLLGQNVNGWHGTGQDGREWGFGRLIRALAQTDGLDRIRYTTSHPNDMADDLIAAHGEVPQLMPYLHLPVQSGSDRILKAMNRRHTADHYLRLIDRIRAARPDIILTSDFIVGFPGETEQDHADTLRLIEQVGFGTAFSFKYSPRPGTPACERPEIDAAVADARLQELQALLARQQKVAQQAMVGRRLGVLFEKPGRLPGQMVGKSDYLHSVFVDAPNAAIGDLVQVDIVESAPNSLRGVLAA